MSDNEDFLSGKPDATDMEKAQALVRVLDLASKVIELDVPMILLVQSTETEITLLRNNDDPRRAVAHMLDAALDLAAKSLECTEHAFAHCVAYMADAMRKKVADEASSVKRAADATDEIVKNMKSESKPDAGI